MNTTGTMIIIIIGLSILGYLGYRSYTLSNTRTEESDVLTESQQTNTLKKGEVRSVDFDLTGLNALEAFPDIKADINAAMNTR